MTYTPHFQNKMRGGEEIREKCACKPEDFDFGEKDNFDAEGSVNLGVGDKKFHNAI